MTKRLYERNQIDLVKIATEQNMNNFSIFYWVDHFPKYSWAIPIKNKETTSVRNAVAHIFINGYLDQF